jgi:hypothetical protein
LIGQWHIGKNRIKEKIFSKSKISKFTKERYFRLRR